MAGENKMLSLCPKCGQELDIGAWPFCDSPGGHASIYPEHAQSFEPLVYDRDPLTGQISYPGSSRDPVPDGYVREELRTIAQVDRFCRARGDEESAKRRENIRAEQQFWDQRIQERRAWVRNEMKKRGYKGKGFEAVTRFLDARRAANYARMLGKDVNFFADVFSFDSSNRETHSSEETAWRQRKA